MVEQKNRKFKVKQAVKFPKISLKEYYVLENKNESQENFEFNNGSIESKTKMMTNKQAFIYKNISDFIVNENYFQKGYRVFAEKEFKTDENKVRIPDMVILDDANVKKTMQGENVIPNLLIEVISETDSFISFEYKLIEYFEAGVKCVWAIMPEIELVYAYSSPRSVVIYSEEQNCSANPAFDFELKTSEIFRK